MSNELPKFRYTINNKADQIRWVEYPLLMADKDVIISALLVLAQGASYDVHPDDIAGVVRFLEASGHKVPDKWKHQKEEDGLTPGNCLDE